MVSILHPSTASSSKMYNTVTQLLIAIIDARSIANACVIGSAMNALVRVYTSEFMSNVWLIIGLACGVFH